MPSIRVQATALSIETPIGQRLLELCEEKLLPIQLACRAGACGTCAFRVVENPTGITPITKMEQAFFKRNKPTNTDNRLACQCRVVGNVVIEIL